MKTVLIPWVYHGAFGHVVEAIEAANNYKAAHPNCLISVVLSEASSSRIVQYCPWIDKTYLISLDKEIEPQVQAIPREWDHVVYPLRLSYQPEHWYTPHLLHVNRTLQQHLRPRLGAQFDQGELLAGVRLACNNYSEICMSLPDATVKWASSHRDSNASPVISILLNGSAPDSAFPSLRTWRRILNRIVEEFPTASLWLTGLSQAKNRYGFRTAAQRNRAVSRLSRTVPRMTTFIDVGLEKQLALIAASDMFIAPHTGFSFLAPCVGTPWLALSGGTWGDCTAGNTPFYFSVPPCDRYPCYGRRKLICQLHDRLHTPVPCVSSMLHQRIEDVLNGIRHLLSPAFDLKKSFDIYRSRALEQKVDVDALWRIRKYYSDIAEGHAGS